MPKAHRPCHHVERHQVAGKLAGEHHTARRRGDGCDNRPSGPVAPLHRSGRGVYAGYPAPLHRVQHHAPAQIILKGHKLYGIGEGISGAPVHRWCYEHVGTGVMGGPVPLHAAENTRAGMRPCRGYRRFGVRDGRERRFEHTLVAIAIDHAQHAVLASRGHEVARLAAHCRSVERTHLC